jgi:ferredoxin
MPKITFVNEKRDLEVESGTNLRQAAQKEGIRLYPSLTLYLNCRGLGLCGTCKVLVTKGMENLSPPTLMERINLMAHPHTVFSRIGHEKELRLACQVKVNGDCTVVTQPAFNWSGENFWQKPYPNK